MYVPQFIVFNRKDLDKRELNWLGFDNIIKTNAIKHSHRKQRTVPIKKNPLLFIPTDKEIKNVLTLEQTVILYRPRKQWESIGKMDKNIIIEEGFKYCPICKNIKKIEYFGLNKNIKDGHGYYCKKCNYERYQKPNNDKRLIKTKLWQNNNKDAHREFAAKTRKKPFHRLNRKIREKLSNCLRGHNRIHIDKIVGCSRKELMDYLQIKFSEGMGWDNYGKTGWHIDHIVPLIAFDYDIPIHKIWCWNYKNLQPIWMSENMNKSDILPGGYRARILKRHSPDKLKEIVGAMLESLGITTKEDYLKSFNLKSKMGPENFSNLSLETSKIEDEEI